jgi:hypothetical protein
MARTRVHIGKEAEMSITSHQATLAFQLARPLCVPRDMGGVLVPKLAEKITPHYDAEPNTFCAVQAVPEVEALRFYLLQHAMSDIRQKYLPAQILPPHVLEVVERYHAECNDLAIRMFYYLIMICTREARHIQGGSSWYAKLESMFGSEIALLLRDLPSSSHTAGKKFLTNAPNVPVKRFCEALVYSFNHGSWGSQFGGAMWAEIADTLRLFVVGERSPEQMLDRVFSLEHNCAPIFNKGMMFENQDQGVLKMVLDVQAAGQVPQLIHEAKSGKKAITAQIKSLHAMCVKAVGSDFTKPVDWFAVEAMGKGYYATQKQHQLTVYGAESSEYAAKAQKAESKALRDAAKQWFEINSKLKLKKIKRP